MQNLKQYCYVGPKHLLFYAKTNIERFCVTKKEDVLAWIQKTQQYINNNNTVIATFIINTDCQLWITDRCYEHIACAQGQHVLSAGEVSFTIENNQPYIYEISNQSTGYCPEPDSWISVKQALSKVNIPHPSFFTITVLFRFCTSCHTTNIIKDDIYECSVCGSVLNANWNYGQKV